jgi:hypothetical protein
MDTLQLNQLAAEVGRAVQASLSLDEISFGTLHSSNDTVSASGFVRRGDNTHQYFFDAEQTHKLLSSPDIQVRHFLQGYFEDCVHRFLDALPK